MRALQEMILQEGRVLPNNILQVDQFLNHQVDTLLMEQVGIEFAKRFAEENVTKVLTLEASGIVPANMTALKLGVPLIIAKKSKSLTLAHALFTADVHSYTKRETSNIAVAENAIHIEDRILIIDDFLANGEATKGLLTIIEKAGATTVGVGIVIEKSFQPGRQWLDENGIRVESLARISSLQGGTVAFVKESALIEE